MQISGIGGGSDALSIAKMIEEMRKNTFERMDEDQDGHLKGDELNEVADRTGLSVSELIDKYDADQNGMLNREEADKIADDLDAAMRTRMAMRLFEKLDKNEDEVLDADELAELAEKSGLTADEILEKYDANQDGVIDAGEAELMAEELRPPGPPPPPPPMESESTGDEASSIKSDMLQSLLDALKASENSETTNSLLAQYTQALIDLYGVDQTE